MKKLLSLLFLSFIALTTFAQTTIRLHADSVEQTINKNIYGHFAEHLGRSIYGGFYVGDTSKIPNTNGVRNDVIAALRKLKNSNAALAWWLFCRYLSLEGWRWTKRQTTDYCKSMVGRR